MSDNVAVLALEPIRERRSPTMESLRRFIHHRSAQVGLSLLGFMVLIAIFAGVLAPFDPIVPLENVVRRSGPCIHLLGCPATQPEHLMGIDSNNRDLFSRILYGSRFSLYIGFATISFAIVVGGLIGLT